MNVQAAFGRIMAALETAKVPAMLAGSFAAAQYGLARATQVVDIVVDPSSAQLRRFVRSLPPDEAYVSLPAAMDALARRSMFNVVDFESGWKFDLILRKDRPFSRGEFDRRVEIDYLGRRVAVATAEDVILSKLEWAKAGGSLRQIEDAAGILQIQHALDAAYLERWVVELDIRPQWEAACAAAGR